MWLSENSVTDDLRSIKAMELQKSFSRFLDNNSVNSSSATSDEAKESIIDDIKKFPLLNSTSFDCFTDQCFLEKYNCLINNLTTIKDLLREIERLAKIEDPIPYNSRKKEQHGIKIETYKVLRHDVLDQMTEVLFELRKGLEIY